MPRQTPTSAGQSLPQAVLLDLGGVVLDIDPQACFVSWATAAGVDAELIASRWAVDDAYKAFEVGAMGFAEYTDSLSRRLGVTLAEEQWMTGWNALLRGPFQEIAGILPAVARRLPLYAFSNTNAVHEAVWRTQLAGVLGSFRKVYTSCGLGLRKPDEAAYLAVALDMGVDPGAILFIDDNAENVAGARAAGLRVWHATSPASTLEALKSLAR
ncbi:MAG: HAD family phosphatase [Gammaproteobacteria bacterium]|nr:HAD family phosphatase [Gammaproteobacteria bacterium]